MSKACCIILGICWAAANAEWRFTEVSGQAGLAIEHGYRDGITSEPRGISGGAAAADVNGDGWVDIYAVQGDLGSGLLYLNRGDGTFVEAGAAWGLPQGGSFASGPAFGDIDNDGRPDLFLGGIEGAKPRLFRNTGSAFVEVTAQSGLTAQGDTMGCGFGDYDRDGDLDLFLAHWQLGLIRDNHLWRNNGDLTFTPVDDTTGIDGFQAQDYSFTPNFADIDNDGWPDLLVACDFGTSQVYRNLGGHFENITDTVVISDENGMGAAIGDVDHDGDLDWFVSSIWDPNGVSEGNWGITGNRFYRNRGDGRFEDATDEAGLRRGYWGWGSAFADFNNDGWQDLVHVNGFHGPLASEYWADPTRLFIADGHGGFAERAVALGVEDNGQGRGVICFDYDRDGDLDIMTINNSGPARLYRNEDAPGNWFGLRFASRPGPTAMGTRAWVTAGGQTQMHELHSRNSFKSNQPDELWFGLGDVSTIDLLTIRFPDGETRRYRNLAPNQWVSVTNRGLSVPALSGWGFLIFAVGLTAAGLIWMRRQRRPA